MNIAKIIVKFVTVFGLCLSLLIAGCSTTGLVILNKAVTAQNPHNITNDLTYGEQPWQRLDVYPNGSLAKAPVALFLYGGGWDSGRKGQYLFAAEAFVKRGYTVVVPDYIKYPNGTFPSFVKDAAKAFEWTKKHISEYNGNPDNVFIVGHSAGAHIGALLATDNRYLSDVGYTKSDIRGFAGLAGPYGFTPKAAKYVAIFKPASNYPKMKAMNFIDGTEPPTLLAHGMSDKVVGVLNKDTLLDKLNAAGVKTHDIEYPGVSHVGILLKLHPWFDAKHQVADDIDAFFKPLIR
jgi:acetyl esterase/lipase